MTTPDLTQAPWKERNPNNQLSAYYFSFDPTGCDAVDDILRAVAYAGKACHSTQEWDYKSNGFDLVEWIQAAANEAAKKISGDVK